MTERKSYYAASEEEKLAQIREDFDRIVADPTTYPAYRQQLLDLEYCYTTPPPDPDLKAIWFAYGPFRKTSQNPAQELAQRLFPEQTIDRPITLSYSRAYG